MVEGDETITIPGTTTVAGLNVSDAIVTLTDDDKSTSDPGEEDDKDSAELSITGSVVERVRGQRRRPSPSPCLKAVAKPRCRSRGRAPLGHGCCGEGTDLSEPPLGTVTFAANSAAGATQSITITATDDALSETAESFTVTLGDDNLDAVVSVVVEERSKLSATATIAASDPITISISGPSNVDEGDATSSYTVSLSPDGVTPTADLTVSYATSSGTATAGSDYTAKSGTLTFTNTAAGSQTFTVSTTEDTFDESGETFTVTISSPSGGGGPTPTLGTSKVGHHDD